MNKYYFLYKNSTGEWNEAINPVFIAKHTYCRAVLKEAIHGLGFEFVADFIHALNDIFFLQSDSFSSIVLEYELI